MTKKVGIMGGTFNPIHVGHLMLAESARDTFQLDEVLFIPSGIPYMKKEEEIVPAETRMSMTALAIQENPHFAISVIEAKKNRNSYTCETLTELRKRNPQTEYYLLMGADSLFAIESWREPEIIFSQSVVIAAVRTGHNEEECRTQAEFLRNKYQADVRLLPAKVVDISSTEIREKVKEKKSIRYLVPNPVMEYIRKKNLYV